MVWYMCESNKHTGGTGNAGYNDRPHQGALNTKGSAVHVGLDVNKDSIVVAVASRCPHSNDFRKSQGRRHSLACILGLISAAMLSSVRGYKGIWIWCDELSLENRRHFRCRISRGKRHVPPITVIRNVMMKLNPDELQRCINDFCAKHFGTPE